MTQHRRSRREFMGLTGVGLAGVIGATRLGSTPVAAAVPEPQDADLVVYNAKVSTMDSSAPRAEGFAIKAARFVAVGSTAEMRSLIGKSTERYDAKGMTIVPGFIDCHNHAGGTTLLYEVLVGNPYNSDKFHFYGEELMKRCMAFRSFLDAAIPAAAGSDFSPGPFAPLMGIQGMVTRKGWNGEVWGVNQKVTVDEALRINTFNGAFASREESIKGSITPGKLADYVVLSDDLHSVNPDKIKDTQIVRTVVGGSTKYQA